MCGSCFHRADGPPEQHCHCQKDEQFGERHGVPDGIGVEKCGKQQDQRAADEGTPGHGDAEGELRPEDRLEEVSGEDVEGDSRKERE